MNETLTVMIKGKAKLHLGLKLLRMLQEIGLVAHLTMIVNPEDLRPADGKDDPDAADRHEAAIEDEIQRLRDEGVEIDIKV